MIHFSDFPLHQQAGIERWANGFDPGVLTLPPLQFSVISFFQQGFPSEE